MRKNLDGRNSAEADCVWTMKPSMMNKRSLLTLTLVGAVGAAALHETRDEDLGLLRKKRIDPPSSPIVERGEQLSEDGDEEYHPAMRDLWEQAAAAAQVELELERMLESSSEDRMSMPSSPSRPTRPSRPPISHPTPAPNRPSGPPVDCLQGRTREEYIYDLLVPITPANILNDPSTPQGAAFEYLANDDPHLEDPCVSDTIEQRYGLTTLYYSTQGDDWLNREGWLGADQECSWHGVTCRTNPTIVSTVILSK